MNEQGLARMKTNDTVMKKGGGGLNVLAIQVNWIKRTGGTKDVRDKSETRKRVGPFVDDESDTFNQSPPPPLLFQESSVIKLYLLL